MGSHLRNAFSNPGVTRRDELALVLWSSPTRDPATRPTCHTRGNGLGAAPSGLRAPHMELASRLKRQVSNRRAGEDEQRLLKLAQGRATYNGTRTGRAAARQPRKGAEQSCNSRPQFTE